MNVRRTLAFFAAASVLGACSGGSHSAFVPSAPGGSIIADRTQSQEPQKVRGTAKLELRLEIPRRSKRARYISPSTHSISIKERGTTLGTFNTTPTSKGCVGSGTGTVCRFSTLAAPGTNETITVDTYDGGGASGNLLSEAAVVKTIAASKANSIGLTLNGVPASLILHLSNANPTQGTSATLTLTVTAKDADGNVIIGPGNFAHAISLLDNATAVATLSASSVISPSSASVSVHYTGAVGNATFTASASGVTNATATLVSVKPHSSYVGGVWAAIPGAAGVPYYHASATSSFGLSGGGMTAATAVAVDDVGGVIAGDASGRIERWPINAKDSQTPTQSLTGAGNVTALAWDAKHQRIIYAAQSSGSFCVVNANASGVVGGVQTCYTSAHYLLDTTVSGLAVDPNTGTLWVANATPVASGGGSGGCPLTSSGAQSCVSLLIFSLQSNGTYNFSGFVDLYDCTGPYWNNVGQIAFDPSHVNGDYSKGVLWIADATPGNDVVYGIGSNSLGCTLPNTYSFDGDGSNLAQPYSLAWDGSDGVWVGDQATTFLQHWTDLYDSPALATGGSYYLGSADGNKSPTSIAVFSVYAGH